MGGLGGSFRPRVRGGKPTEVALIVVVAPPLRSARHKRSESGN